MMRKKFAMVGPRIKHSLQLCRGDMLPLNVRTAHKYRIDLLHTNLEYRYRIDRHFVIFKAQ